MTPLATTTLGVRTLVVVSGVVIIVGGFVGLDGVLVLVLALAFSK